jgi:hypothetical protein
MVVTTKLMGRRFPRIPRTACAVPQETTRTEQAEDHRRELHLDRAA